MYYHRLKAISSAIITSKAAFCNRFVFHHSFARCISTHNKTHKFIPSRQLPALRNVLISSRKYLLWTKDDSHQQHSREYLAAAFKAETATEDQISKSISKFKLISEMKNADIHSEVFGNIWKSLIKVCPNLSEAQIIQVLEIFARIQIDGRDWMNDHVVELRKALSDACQRYSQHWDLNRLLIVNDIWYSVPRGNQTDFARNACQLMEANVNDMTPDQLVQTLFYMYWTRHRPSKIGAFQGAILRHIDQLTLSEASVAVAAFGITRSTIKNIQLIEAIYTKILNDDMRPMSDISLSFLLKTLRTFSKWEVHNPLNASLQEKLIWDAEHRSLLTALHICLLGTTLHVCNNDILTIVSERYLNHIGELRLKDMERIAWALVLFDFKSKSGVEIKLFDAIRKELPKRTEEMEKHSLSFVMCANYLSMRGCADAALIGRILNPSYLMKAFGKPEFFIRELLFLDSYAQINLKNSYKGPLLNEAQRQRLASAYSNENNSADRSSADKLAINVMKSIMAFTSYWPKTRALPHYARKDIFAVIDKRDRKAIDIPTDSFPSPQSGKLFSAQQLTGGNANLEVFVFIIATEQQLYESKDGEQLTGVVQFKVNQLRLLGMHPVVIWHSRWSKMDKDQRDNYIAEYITSVLDNLKQNEVL